MARRSKYRFKTRAEYEVAMTKLEAEKFQHFVALHELLEENDHQISNIFGSGGGDDYEGYKNIIRESGGNYVVALLRPLAPNGGTVLIREKTSTSTFTSVYEFEEWHATIQERLRKGLIPMHVDEWALVGIATKLWDARRNLFDNVVEKAT
ncbi:hypothetical protein LCGC14_2641610 [marine sediment metagenome]|uniref:Uncharacterized protein n=1 Tax=marine sediment metagenome TaxID=412755 RepID=A0A0F8ZX99_9ZZZZ